MAHISQYDTPCWLTGADHTDILPTNFDVPLFWQESDLDELKGSLAYGTILLATRVLMEKI